ncbi:hypothetical protein [Psychrobacter sp. I-STPA6b]|uniref:hypothetical protein n=1 Tax=Psychrobacter sp. I-STPA6b TaxID=2585718 RepID=UPI001D0C2267|nr:hypothetical protein [Psychrobacter sp. I-STPA6b]
MKIPSRNWTELDNLINKINTLKDKSSISGNEDKANHYWRLRETFSVYKLYIQSFDYLKDRNYRKAWYILEECELMCENISSNSNHQFLINSGIVLIQRLVNQWQALYPYILFISPEYKIKRTLCSICGGVIKPRTKCSHKKGILYNGELCFHIIDDFEILNYSIVTKPVQKYSVIHDDDRLNFNHINYLIDLLDHPFENWSFERKTMSYPIHRFNSLSQEDRCPCHSKASFKNCCINKSEISIPHIDYIFDKQLPSEKYQVLFPY